MSRHFEVTVMGFEMTDEEAEALFDRVIDVAHALDEQVICSGGWVEETPA
jgi:hypothetical protein